MIGEGRSPLQTAMRTMIGGWSASAGFIVTLQAEQKPSDMACSRCPSTIFSWDSSRFCMSAWPAMMRTIEGTRADRAGVIGLIRQVWGWRQISQACLIVIGSVQIRVPDRAIGVRSVRRGTTKGSEANFEEATLARVATVNRDEGGRQTRGLGSCCYSCPPNTTTPSHENTTTPPPPPRHRHNGERKRGHCERGLFNRGISRISQISNSLCVKDVHSLEIPGENLESLEI